MFIMFDRNISTTNKKNLITKKMNSTNHSNVSNTTFDDNDNDNDNDDIQYKIVSYIVITVFILIVLGILSCLVKAIFNDCKVKNKTSSLDTRSFDEQDFPV